MRRGEVREESREAEGRGGCGGETGEERWDGGEVGYHLLFQTRSLLVPSPGLLSVSCPRVLAIRVIKP